MAEKKSKPRPHAAGAGMAVKKGGKDPLQLNGRIWLQKGGVTWLSWGRVVLLERIRETGSINAAAKSMGMGYRHAWDLVEEMNRLASAPLVTRSTGGAGGGGTRLTPEGEAAVGEFWKVVEEFRKWVGSRKISIV